MSKEFPQKNISPDINPEHAVNFDFKIERENPEDRTRGILRIRDGANEFIFSLSAEGKVRSHGDLRRLTPEKARAMMRRAAKILEERRAQKDISEKEIPIKFD